MGSAHKRYSCDSCLFVAKTVNRATRAHFFGLNQIKNIVAYGGKPKIIPLELDLFMKLVENSYNHVRVPTPANIRSFLQAAIDEIDNSNDENEWSERIQQCAEKWLIA